jgi:hypothetical protein
MRLILGTVVALVYSVDRAFLDGQPARLSLPTHAPWHNVPWGLFLPLVFVCNVVVAALAWIIVWLVMR